MMVDDGPWCFGNGHGDHDGCWIGRSTCLNGCKSPGRQVVAQGRGWGVSILAGNGWNGFILLNHEAVILSMTYGGLWFTYQDKPFSHNHETPWLKPINSSRQNQSLRHFAEQWSTNHQEPAPASVDQLIIGGGRWFDVDCFIIAKVRVGSPAMVNHGHEIYPKGIWHSSGHKIPWGWGNSDLPTSNHRNHAPSSPAQNATERSVQFEHQRSWAVLETTVKYEANASKPSVAYQPNGSPVLFTVLYQRCPVVKPSTTPSSSSQTMLGHGNLSKNGAPQNWRFPCE